MNAQEYLKSESDLARGAFIKAYLAYHETWDFEIYGNMHGAMLVYEKLSGDYSGDLWESAKELHAYLVENNLPTV
jgi:hypothetical protein